MTKKTTTFALAAALSATMLLAQRPFGERQGRAAQSPDALVAHLELSEDQVTALRENAQASRQAMREAMQDRREKMQQFRDAVENEDANLIGQLVLAQKQTREELKGIREQYKSSALEILNADQKAKLSALEQQLDAMKELRPVVGQAGGLLLLGGDGEGFGPNFGRRGGPGFGDHGPRGRHSK